jgi:hypothetical protein
MDPIALQTLAPSPEEFKATLSVVLAVAAQIRLVPALYLATGCAVRFLGEKFAWWGYFALAAAIQFGWH